MDKKKILIIVILALIVLLYVFFVVWGGTSPGPRKGQKDNDSDAKKFEKNPPPGIKGFGGFMSSWFGGLLPRAKIPDCPKPSSKDLLCENLGATTLAIPAADTSFRAIKVVLTSGGQNPARIKYTDFKDMRAGDNKLFPDGQSFDLPNIKHDLKTEENIIVLKEGGSLEITCPKNNSPCKVNIE